MALHDVRLVVYDGQGRLLCRKELGTISDQSARIDVELDCTGFPAILTFDARESPCRDVNRLSVKTYQGESDEYGHRWKEVRYRKCNEGLPPNVEVTANVPAGGE